MDEQTLDKVLQAVEREKRKKIVHELFVNNIDGSDLKVRADSLKILTWMAKIDRPLYVEMFRHALRIKVDNFVAETAKTVEAVAEHDASLYEQLVTEGMASQNRAYRKGIEEALLPLNSINPELFNNYTIEIITNTACTFGKPKRVVELPKYFFTNPEVIALATSEFYCRLMQVYLEDGDYDDRIKLESQLYVLSSIHFGEFLVEVNSAETDHNLGRLYSIVRAYNDRILDSRPKYLEKISQAVLAKQASTLKSMLVTYDIDTLENLYDTDSFGHTEKELMLDEIIQTFLKIDSTPILKYLTSQSDKRWVEDKGFTELLCQQIIQFDPELYKTLLGKMSFIKNAELNDLMGESIYIVARQKPDVYIDLFNYCMDSNNSGLINGALQTLDHMREIDPTKFIEVYMKYYDQVPTEIHGNLFFHFDTITRIDSQNVKKMLMGIGNEIIDAIFHQEYNLPSAVLLEIVPTALLQKSTIHDLIADKFDHFKRLYQSIGGANGSDHTELDNLELRKPNSPISIYGIFENCSESMQSMVRIKEFISQFKTANPALYASMLKNDILETRLFQVSKFPSMLDYLINSHPAAYLEIYKALIGNPDSDASESLKLFLSSTEKPQLTISKDDFNEFAVKYLESRYAQNPDGTPKDAQTLISELKGVLGQKGVDYARLKAVLEAGEAATIEEMAECASIDIRIGDQIIRKLGHGIRGHVYKAYSPDLSIERAIKLIPLDKVEKKEPQLLSILSRSVDPHIVKIYEAGGKISTFRGNPVYSIVMEYIGGKTLKEIMENSMLSSNQVVKYGLGILHGIQTLRKFNIIHRDLKPQNIMVTPEEIVKIIDFGFSTDHPEESFELNRAYGGHNDLFSLGLILYRLISGKHLIGMREEGMGTETYKNRIYDLRKMFYASTGSINHEYQQKLSRLTGGIGGLIEKCLLFDPDIGDILFEFNRTNAFLNVYSSK